MWKPLLWRLVRDLAGWPVESQLQARRNALVASTALAQRRRERAEVEEFLARQRQPLPDSMARTGAAHPR
jgi:hypothetical protein